MKYDHYTMYNVAHHSFFDQENGRVIYFEGTYTREFSDAPVATPRYNYNQLMYRLDLADARLALPVAVYQVKGRYLLRDEMEREKLWDKIEGIPFFAFDRPGEGRVAVYGEQGSLRLKGSGEATPNFYALPMSDRSDSPSLINIPAERPIVRVYRNSLKEFNLDGSARPPGQ